MELGQRLRQARLEANLSQRALCGQEITRNMLSRIENGAARPSMKTLQYLAGRLGKPVSYFLEETAVLSPNGEVMESARRLYDEEKFDQAALALESYRSPDSVYDREEALLWVLARLGQAEQALGQGKFQYARSLLEKTETAGVYCAEVLERRRRLLLGRVPGGPEVADGLPSLDEELLLRAREALSGGDPRRAARLLDAMEVRDTPRWMLLRGQACMGLLEYANAVSCLRLAEGSFPEQVIPKLELCYRELKDYRNAYFYACKQKKAEAGGSV